MALTPFLNFLSDLSAERLDEIDALYAPDIDFADPMNSAADRDHLKRIEADLFKQLQNIRFELHEHVEGEAQAFVRWTMKYSFRSKSREIEGSTFLKFNDTGLITYQRDYWDSADGVFGEFPIMGLAIKGIRKALSVK